MSLFYGYSDPRQAQAIKSDKVRTIFDVNVTRAKVVESNLLSGYLGDDQGPARSVLFCLPLSDRDPDIDRTSTHHFLHQGRSRTSAIFANLPRLVFCDISVYVVVRRMSVMSTGYEYEAIMSNDDGDWDKMIAYRSGRNDAVSVGDVYGSSLKECLIPARFIGTKYLLSVHWLTGFDMSHVRINNGAIPNSTLTADINQIGKPYFSVFSLNDQKKYYSDIRFYGMRIVEGRPSTAEIKEVCDSMMAEHGLK